MPQGVVPAGAAVMHAISKHGPDAAALIDELVREGAGRMLAEALQAHWARERVISTGAERAPRCASAAGMGKIMTQQMLAASCCPAGCWAKD